jgi:tripartite-type tricarboxylate transporter receptor subunit TctC
MKHFIFTLALLFSASSYALPAQFNVYSSQVSGTKDTNCRILFDLYSKKYNATPVFLIRKGASGMVAMKEMLRDNNFSVLCSGPSESVYNNAAYPGNEADHKLLSMVTIISLGPTTLYTRPGSKAPTIQDLLKLDRPITIGHNAQGPKSAAQAIFKGKSIIWVPFTNSVDSLPSLLDGGLDVYADSGSLEELSNAGKILSLGHLNGTKQVGGPDLAKDFPVAAQLPAFVAITTSSNNDPKDIQELNKRLVSIITGSEEVKNIIGKIGWEPVGYSVDKSNRVVEQIRATIERLENAK